MKYLINLLMHLHRLPIPNLMDQTDQMLPQYRFEAYELFCTFDSGKMLKVNTTPCCIVPMQFVRTEMIVKFKLVGSFEC